MAGVTSREEVQGADASPPRDGASSDVLLVEGGQVRYGSKAAWQSIVR